MSASKESDERYTPEHVLEVVRRVAPIALDPCTTPGNPTGAARFFTAASDGLAQPWLGDGLVWVNPPYSRGALAAWTRRVAREGWTRRECIVLTPCDLGTRWAASLFACAQAAAFWRGRIAFGSPDGQLLTGAKTASCFWYFGERSARFARAFNPHANVVQLRALPTYEEDDDDGISQVCACDARAGHGSAQGPLPAHER